MRDKLMDFQQFVVGEALKTAGIEGRVRTKTGQGIPGFVGRSGKDNEYTGPSKEYIDVLHDRVFRAPAAAKETYILEALRGRTPDEQKQIVDYLLGKFKNDAIKSIIKRAYKKQQDREDNPNVPGIRPKSVQAAQESQSPAVGGPYPRW
jgi:hypothetical protein